MRVATHGYRARVTFKTDGLETDSYEIAVRGPLRRKGLGDGPALIVDTAARKAWRVAAGGRSATPVGYAEAEKELPAGIPLEPGFDEKKEAARRNVTVYHREGDEVFAGHACAIWRFDDDPSGPQLPDDDVLGRDRPRSPRRALGAGDPVPRREGDEDT